MPRLLLILCYILHWSYMNLGKTWKVGARGRVHIYPYQEKNPTGPIRTNAQTRSSAREALSTDKIVSEYWCHIQNTL